MKKRLGKYANDAVNLAAVRRANALRHFLLKHAGHLRDALAMFNHLKHNLGADVVGEVARNRHLLFAKVGRVDFQKIANKIRAVIALFGDQVVDALLVYFR